MNKITKTMQKISQKMNNLKKKISNIIKKNFVEMTHNFNTHAFTFASQKINKSKQTLNVKTTTIRINSDVDKKMFVKKSTHNFMNLITINCQNIIKIIKLQNKNIKIIIKSFQIKKFLKKNKT